MQVKITVCSAGKQLQQCIAAAEAGGRHGCNGGRVQQAALPRCFFGDGDRLRSSCCNVDAKSDGGKDDDDDDDDIIMMMIIMMMMMMMMMMMIIIIIIIIIIVIVMIIIFI